MAKHIEDIKTKIQEKLNDMDTLRHSYKYPKGDVQGYPYAVIMKDNFNTEFADFSATSKRNIRTFNFSILVYTDASEAGFGPEKAERISDEVADELITAFDMDTTLSGTVRYTQVEGLFDFQQEGEVARIGNFNLEVGKIADSR